MRQSADGQPRTLQKRRRANQQRKTWPTPNVVTNASCAAAVCSIHRHRRWGAWMCAGPVCAGPVDAGYATSIVLLTDYLQNTRSQSQRASWWRILTVFVALLSCVRKVLLHLMYAAFLSTACTLAGAAPAAPAAGQQ